MKLEMIFFDMGGTLDLYPGDSEYVKSSCAKMAEILINAGVEEIKSFSAEAFREKVLAGFDSYKKWRVSDYVELTPEELWKNFILNDIDIDQNVLDEIAEELTFLIDTGFVRRRAREETKEVLEAIKGKNIRMGIISNVLSRGQVPWSMAQYEISDYFDTVVLSSVFGRRKPHPEIFKHACRKASVRAENILYIGNSPFKDIKGARDAGIGCTVLIEYEGNSPHDTGPEADFEIKNLRELIPIIEKISEANI